MTSSTPFNYVPMQDIKRAGTSGIISPTQNFTQEIIVTIT